MVAWQEEQWFMFTGMVSGRFYRAPGGFGALGLQVTKCRAPVLQDGKIGTLAHPCFAPGFFLAGIVIFVRVQKEGRLRTVGLHHKISEASGPKDSPVECKYGAFLLRTEAFQKCDRL